MSSELLRRDDLVSFLSPRYTHFVDEECRLVDIKKFPDLFIYKYGTFGDTWCFWVEYKKKYNELHCQNVGGFTFIFPLSVF